MNDRPCNRCHGMGYHVCRSCGGRGEAGRDAGLRRMDGLCSACLGAATVSCEGCGSVGVQPPKLVLG